MQNIGFIGTGLMGQFMIKNLMKSGYNVSIYTRTKSKAQELINNGAIWCNSIQELCENQDFIITMVGYPKDVEEIYIGKILEYAKENTYLIDMTTSNPELAKKIYEIAKERNLHALDAPVSGGITGAEQGTLSIMVGGDKEDFDHCSKIFDAMGKNIRYMGNAGCGQITKAANQTIIAGTLSGVCEAIRLVESCGMDPKKMCEAVDGGAASSFQLSKTAPLILEDKMNATFYLKHYVKDLKIALETAKSHNINLPILERVLENYIELETNGYGDMGHQALIKKYRK